MGVVMTREEMIAELQFVRTMLTTNGLYDTRAILDRVLAALSAAPPAPTPHKPIAEWFAGWSDEAATAWANEIRQTFAPTGAPALDICADCEHPREYHQSSVCGIEECGCMEFRPTDHAPTGAPADWTLKAVTGALVSFLAAHGSLTRENAPSAAKRILGLLTKGDQPAVATGAPDELVQLVREWQEAERTCTADRRAHRALMAWHPAAPALPPSDGLVIPPADTIRAVIAGALDAMEHGATALVRRAAWNALRAAFYPLPAPALPPDTGCGPILSGHPGVRVSLTDAPVAALPPVEADTTPTVEQRYHELLYQVGTKFSGETRHETAKRYLRTHEDQCGKGGPATGRRPSPQEAT